MKSPMAKRVSVDRWLFIVTLLLVFVGPGDGVQRLGGHGEGALSAPDISFCSRQIGWAVAGIVAMVVAMRVDYQPLQASGRGLFIAGHHHADADLGFLSRPRAQYASLDPLGRLLIPAFRTGQARSHSVSGIFSREPHQVHGRLAQYTCCRPSCPLWFLSV